MPKEQAAIGRDTGVAPPLSRQLTSSPVTRLQNQLVLAVMFHVKHAHPSEWQNSLPLRAGQGAGMPDERASGGAAACGESTRSARESGIPAPESTDIPEPVRTSQNQSAPNCRPNHPRRLIKHAFTQNFDAHVTEPVLLNLLGSGVDLSRRVHALEQREFSPVAQ